MQHHQAGAQALHLGIAFGYLVPQHRAVLASQALSASQLLQRRGPALSTTLLPQTLYTPSSLKTRSR